MAKLGMGVPGFFKRLYAMTVGAQNLNIIGVPVNNDATIKVNSDVTVLTEDASWDDMVELKNPCVEYSTLTAFSSDNMKCSTF